MVGTKTAGEGHNLNTFKFISMAMFDNSETIWTYKNFCMWFHFSGQIKNIQIWNFGCLCVFENPRNKKIFKNLTTVHQNCDWRWRTQIKVEIGELKVNNLIAEEYWVEEVMKPSSIAVLVEDRGRKKWWCIWEDEMILDQTDDIRLNILDGLDYSANFIKTMGIKKTRGGGGHRIIAIRRKYGIQFLIFPVFFSNTQLASFSCGFSSVARVLSNLYVGISFSSMANILSFTFLHIRLQILSRLLSKLLNDMTLIPLQ